MNLNLKSFKSWNFLNANLMPQVENFRPWDSFMHKIMKNIVQYYFQAM